jgi:hypothetical protein
MITDMASEYLTLVKEEQDSLVNQVQYATMVDGPMGYLFALVRFIVTVVTFVFCCIQIRAGLWNLILCWSE